MTIIDCLTSFFCGVAALALFTVHAFSSPTKTHWLSLPPYVRLGFLAAGVFLMVRSVNFATLGPMEPGRTNIWGLLATLSTAYAFTAFAFWILANSLQGHAWERINWFKREAQDDPELVPVLMPLDQVADVARASGIRAAGPGEGPEALSK